MTDAGDRARHAFARSFGSEPAIVSSAPGRVNLIGEHTDYNEGWVLPAAIDRRAFVAASPRPSTVVTLRADDLDQSTTFRLTEISGRSDRAGQPLPAWALYPAGIAYSLQQAGHRLVGLDAVVASDVPIGAGLSSSAAVEVAFAQAWCALSGLDLDQLTLARLCQQGENEYVGVRCGLMDPFAALFGRQDCALWLDTRDASWEPVDLPAELALVVADSGVRHALGTSAYNDRRRECEEAARQLARWLPGVSALRDVTPAQLEKVGGRLPDPLGRRARHVVEECDRVRRAVECLRAGDYGGLGQVLQASHASLRDSFEVSHPDVDLLVALANRSIGCYGSRLTGAGFGGSTISLVARNQAMTFAEDLVRAYDAATGRTSQAWVCRASDGATVET
jgi:galactokinase